MEHLAKKSQYNKPCMYMLYRNATLPKLISYSLNPNDLYILSEKDTLGKRIKKLRKLNNMTSSELANKIGVTASGILGYENNKAYPSRKIILKLYNIFGQDLLCDSYSRFIVKDYMSIIEGWRIKNNLTKKDAAKKLCITEGFYYSLIKGEYEITHSYFNKIKDKLMFYQLTT